MRRRPTFRDPRALLRMVALFATLPAPVVAQEVRDPPARAQRLWATAQLRYTIHDNYFQAPSGQPDSVVQAAFMRLRVVADVVRPLGAQFYVDGRITAHDAFNPTFGAGGGVLAGPRMFRIDVGAGYDRGLPRLDLGDTFARADVAQAHAEARLRLGRVLELTGGGRAIWQALLFPGRDPADAATDPLVEWENFTYVEIEGRARTRLLGRLLSPEVGMGRGRPWNEEHSVFAYVQEHWQVQVRSAPAPPVYLSVRYRVRERDYPYAPEGSSSFGREDRREQIAASLDLRASERLTWNVYYTQEDARSSLARRSFRTRALSLGLTVEGL
jgi:hypothetical protein